MPIAYQPPIYKGTNWKKLPCFICCRLQCCGSGSGLRCFFGPPASGIRIWNPGWWKKSRARIQDPERTSHLIFENLGSVFWVKNAELLWCGPEPGSGILSTQDPGSCQPRIRDSNIKHPGSATSVVLFVSTTFLPSACLQATCNTKRRKTPKKVRKVLWYGGG